MRGQPGYPAYNFGPDEYHYGGSFGVNGASDPETDTIRHDLGFLFTVVHAGTGLYDVTVPATFGLPRPPDVVLTAASVDAMANWFETCVVGDPTFQGGNLTMRICTHQAGTPVDVAEAAETPARVNFFICAQNNTGK